jgi:pimeloyl-ACP methyl ester carboxylesterase
MWGIIILIFLCGAPFILIRWRETRTIQQLLGTQGRHIIINGNPVAVYDQGSGPVIVMLHGFGGWQATWGRVQPALQAAGYRTIGIDAIGAGASSRSSHKHDYTTEAQARNVIAVLDALGIDNATILGHSYGGRIALQTAILSPERVNRIIALAPESLAKERPPIAKIVTIPILGYALAFWSTAPSLTGAGLKAVSKRPDWVVAQQHEYARSVRVQGHLAGQICQSSAPKDGIKPVPKFYKTITCPVFLIWGDRDPVFAVSTGTTLVNTMPDAHLAVIPNTGHVPHEESFDETMAFMHLALSQ